jgi:hypothetical protein
VRGTVRNGGLSASDTVVATLVPAAPLELATGVDAEQRLTAIAAGDSATFEWQVRVMSGYVGCAPASPVLAYTVRSAGADVLACSPAVTLGAQPNLAPEITGYTPATLDTVRAGAQQVFTVQAKDADGDALVYRWVLNGQTVGENRNIHSQIFGQPGMSTLLCVVTDKCADDSVVVSWTFLVDTTTTNVAAVPRAVDLRIVGNYPNPFTPGTLIVAELATPRAVTLEIIDQSGRIVARLVDRQMLAAGRHELVLDASSLPAGVYTARLSSGTAIVTHRMVLVR